MKEKILIVEDKFIEADYLRLMLVKAGYEVMGIAHAVVQAREMINNNKPDFVLLDIFLKGKLTGIDLAKQLSDENIPFVYLSANSNEEVLSAAKATQPYGFLVKPFREKDLLVTLEIARYRHEHSIEANTRKENMLQEKLLAIANDTGSWEKKMLAICTTLKLHISFDYITGGFNTIDGISSKVISFLRIGYEEYQTIGITELLNIAGLNLNDLLTLVHNTAYETMPGIVAEKAFEESCIERSLNKLFSEIFQVKSFIYFPLHLSNGKVFIFCFYCKRPDTYTTAHIGLMNRLQKTMANVMEIMLKGEEKDSVVESPKTGLPPVNPNAYELEGFESIIGKSRALLNVFDLVTQVAHSDTSVLILGESGTGKERIADCMHNLSPRKGMPFVKVNCAALPATLIESELFGHERGSFTGALDKRIGKFEKADKGTIFLDEIGEMPLDLQVKLLRVLQEKYIERIGSRDITRVDVRVIAATNRNLEKEVAEGRFRLDLYYRLNVFPISLPPLRERAEDVPLLADHFIKIYNRKAGKKISGLSEKVLKNMIAYHWPGNIRELENVIERSVLLAKGTIIEDGLLPAVQKKDAPIDFRMKTSNENERDYIITVLKKCSGKIWGSSGAAEILNLPPTTLASKMKKLGIQKEHFE
ncbi:MAG: sigma 54-interacting transcriptional regulator [Ferruginibacter sp.]|nr:sigma 54-interacting transcriptional regulator [Ferruginibacter sp.]